MPGLEFEFRFSVAGGDAISPEDATIFGESCVQALHTVRKLAHDQHASLPGEMSFCRVYPRNVALMTIKPADNGDGVIVRVRETAGKDTEGAIDLNLGSAREVWQCDLVERNRNPLQMQGRTIPFKIRSNAMLTFRMTLKDGDLTPPVRH